MPATKAQQIRNLKRSVEHLRERSNAHNSIGEQLQRDLAKAMAQLEALEGDPRSRVTPRDRTIVYFNKKFPGNTTAYSYVAIFLGDYWYLSQDGVRQLSAIPRMTHDEFIRWVGEDTVLHTLRLSGLVFGDGKFGDAGTVETTGRTVGTFASGESYGS